MLRFLICFSLVDLLLCQKVANFREEYIFKSLASNNGTQCPQPRDKVLLWDPPTIENYNRTCLKKLKWVSKFEPYHSREEILIDALTPSVTPYPEIRGFFHVVLNVSTYLTVNRGDAVFETQLQKLTKSGVLDNASLLMRVGLLDEKLNPEETKCVKAVLESRVEELTNGALVYIEYFNPLHYECDTILTLKKWCVDNKHAFVFYLHNKGKSRESNKWAYPHVVDWREYMMFYLFERYQLCVNMLLHGKKACGVNKRPDPEFHYSGNFWWASCEHVRKNEKSCPLGKDNRFAAEFWVIGENPHPVASLWRSYLHHYIKSFPRDQYNCVDLLM